jgi:hypothetical protein
MRRDAAIVSPLLAFAAEEVGAETIAYTAKNVVYTIAFSVGDPEANGHSWNFSRSFDDDSGVCTVREIQRATLSEGIASFILNRSELRCVFDPKGAAEVGVSELQITYGIDDRAWEELAACAQIVFRDRAYFKLEGQRATDYGRFA